MQNIELKLPLVDRGEAESRLRALGARRVWTRWQRDTFYETPGYWLKLREEDSGDAALIAYRRSTASAAPRPADYERIVVEDAARWSRLLSAVLPVQAVVEKERTLWLVGHTRIHLDRVAGLGDYLELETAIDGITPDEASAENRRIIQALSLDADRFVALPYRDLLAGGHS